MWQWLWLNSSLSRNHVKAVFYVVTPEIVRVYKSHSMKSGFVLGKLCHFLPQREKWGRGRKRGRKKSTVIFHDTLLQLCCTSSPSQCFISFMTKSKNSICSLWTIIQKSMYDGGNISCGDIQEGYFYTTPWGQLLWFCPLAPLLCWHLSVGCGRVRDKQHHRSTSEWLISSELCCPTSEYTCAHPHTLREIQQCCVSGREIVIKECFCFCDLMPFRVKKHYMCRLCQLEYIFESTWLTYQKLIISCWKFISYTHWHCFFSLTSVSAQGGEAPGGICILCD